MRKKVIVVALVAVVSAGGAAIMVQKWLAAERAALAAKNAPAQKVEPTMVLIAQKYMPSGQFIRANQVQWQSWPDANVLPAYLVKGKANLSDFDGAVVRQGIPAGQPITKDMIAQPGERGFLAAVLMPGMRALSVHVDATTGISGFVFPGDRIDLVLSHRIVSKKSTDGDGADSQQISETILTDVRVLAIDQNAADQKGKPQVVKNVTLEVTPEQVEVISVAQQLGRLSLSLRSLARKDGDTDKATTISADGTPEPNVPGRGLSFTRDTQVSRALKNTATGPYIDIVRGKDARREAVNADRTVLDVSSRLKTVAVPGNSVQAATNDVEPQRRNDNTGE